MGRTCKNFKLYTVYLCLIHKDCEAILSLEEKYILAIVIVRIQGYWFVSSGAGYQKR